MIESLIALNKSENQIDNPFIFQENVIETYVWTSPNSECQPICNVHMWPNQDNLKKKKTINEQNTWKGVNVVVCGDSWEANRNCHRSTGGLETKSIGMGYRWS